jgi:hypothetical protein
MNPLEVAAVRYRSRGGGELTRRGSPLEREKDVRAIEPLDFKFTGDAHDGQTFADGLFCGRAEQYRPLRGGGDFFRAKNEIHCRPDEPFPALRGVGRDREFAVVKNDPEGERGLALPKLQDRRSYAVAITSRIGPVGKKAVTAQFRDATPTIFDNHRASPQPARQQGRELVHGHLLDQGRGIHDVADEQPAGTGTGFLQGRAGRYEVAWVTRPGTDAKGIFLVGDANAIAVVELSPARNTVIVDEAPVRTAQVDQQVLQPAGMFLNMNRRVMPGSLGRIDADFAFIGTPKFEAANDRHTSARCRFDPNDEICRSHDGFAVTPEMRPRPVENSCDSRQPLLLREPAARLGWRA